MLDTTTTSNSEPDVATSASKDRGRGGCHPPTTNEDHGLGVTGEQNKAQ